MKLTFVDLVLDNGQLVRIECPEKFEDDLMDSIDNCRVRGEWWSVLQFDGCSATYLGHLIDRVNMQRVVAML